MQEAHVIDSMSQHIQVESIEAVEGTPNTDIPDIYLSVLMFF